MSLVKAVIEQGWGRFTCAQIDLRKLKLHFYKLLIYTKMHKAPKAKATLIRCLITSITSPTAPSSIIHRMPFFLNIYLYDLAPGHQEIGAALVFLN
ncbi:hypothetical protein PILCRDRAFT_564821 [Piloderma croceum F 1598]|uniref:Uncharacterized protein n=1 Tax=Piloderma croceum (strain F 1598) TaxID=765440 RepID=A0A0C3AZA4_PILCF|nr:hypothetical protein PILCRDRAFT_564821 [Piloderma croceum F 1598]